MPFGFFKKSEKRGRSEKDKKDKKGKGKAPKPSGAGDSSSLRSTGELESSQPGASKGKGPPSSTKQTPVVKHPSSRSLRSTYLLQKPEGFVPAYYTTGTTKPAQAAVEKIEPKTFEEIEDYIQEYGLNDGEQASLWRKAISALGYDTGGLAPRMIARKDAAAKRAQDAYDAANREHRLALQKEEAEKQEALRQHSSKYWVRS